MTWLLISHQLVHVRKICDQVHFMEQGNVLVSGTLEEILLHPSICPSADIWQIRRFHIVKMKKFRNMNINARRLR